MTSLEIMTDLGHLLERNKNRYYQYPMLIWKGERLDITDGIRNLGQCRRICSLTMQQITEGPSSTEWTEFVSTIKKSMKGKNQ